MSENQKPNPEQTLQNPMEKQASNALFAKAIYEWQQMDPNSYDEDRVPEHIEGGWEQHFIYSPGGSRGRLFRTEVDGEEVSVGLIFWNEGHPDRFSFVIQEPNESKLTSNGKRKVVATTINLGERFSIQEVTFAEPYIPDSDDIEKNDRELAPEDIPRIEQILENIGSGAIHKESSLTNNVLDIWGPNGGEIWDFHERV